MGLIIFSLLVQSGTRPANVMVGLGTGLVVVGIVLLMEPTFAREISKEMNRAARQSVREAVTGIMSSPLTTVSVLHNGEPLAGATVVTIASNKTWKKDTTDRTGRAYLDLQITQQPVTLYVAAPDYCAHVERDWTPTGTEIEIDLTSISNGGSVIFEEGTGYIPGLSGRLNPILDRQNRTYVYADNISVNDGAQQPVPFTLHQPLLMEDANGNSFQVTVVHIIGRSSLIEYELR
ncbi:MAG: hypothetical protein OXH29_00160 [bacterium]|nr:hypothetical protein [bacterium]